MASMRLFTYHEQLLRCDKGKVDLIFKDTISDYDRQELCTLIYYPREKMALLDEQGKIDSDWYAMTLNQLILVAKLLSSKYTRSKVRKALPEEYAYIIDELLHARRMRMQTRSDITSRY